MKSVQRLSRKRFRHEEGVAARLGYSVIRRDFASTRFGQGPTVPPIRIFTVTRITRRFVTIRDAA